MANKSIFASWKQRGGPAADSRNEAGGIAYGFSDSHALAQYAATGCLNSTFYASAETQVGTILELAGKVDPEFLARTAVYCREQGFMKDTPALLLAVLAGQDAYWFAKAAPRVLDSGRMVRNFVQIMRSGVTGRRSLGSLPKRVVRDWLQGRSAEQLFRDSVGNSPSLADIIRMVHPCPADDAREAMYAYLIGRPYDETLLPDLVRQFEAWKKAPSQSVPAVPFQMLTAMPLTSEQWRQVALQAGWQATRMNLNTFARHGVFADAEATQVIADRLRNPQTVRASRVFPYQLMTAWTYADQSIPGVVRSALHDAMVASLDNVPKFPGKVVVCVDVSGSMSSPVTGHRRGATTVIRCVDAAALMASAIRLRNPGATVLPFDNDVRDCDLRKPQAVMENAKRLAALCGGGTNCSAPLRWLNRHQVAADLVIYLSDNESWMDKSRSTATVTMQEWVEFKNNNRDARLVCIDMQPNRTSQAKEQRDILNIGGFSDQIFTIINQFARGQLQPDHWLATIKAINMDKPDNN